MSRGKYIVIEGPSGVGKTTQSQELARRLRAAGLAVRLLHEPDTPNDALAQTINQILEDPSYTKTTRVQALLETTARVNTLDKIRASIEQGVICVVDQNYLSSLTTYYYGNGLIPDYSVISTLIDFSTDGLQPDLCIVLDAPVQDLRKRITSSEIKSDDAFMERIRAGYLWEAKQRGYPVVFATEEPEAATKSIWKLVTETLAIRTPNNGQVSESASKPASIQQVLAAKELPPHEPPATDVLSGAQNLPAADNSTQLVPLSYLAVAYSGANLVDGPAASDSFYTPTTLAGPLKKEYQVTCKQIMKNYAAISSKLTVQLQGNEALADHIATAVLPVATLRNIPNDALNPTSRYEHLRELQQLYKPVNSGISDASHKNPDVLGAFVRTNLTDNHADDPKEYVTLLDVSPKNELSKLSDMLYPKSGLSLEKIQAATSSWTYEKRSRAVDAYVATLDGAGSVLEELLYSFDVLTSCQTMWQLRENTDVVSIEWQTITPRFGYNVPDIIEDANATELFEECFDLSLRLHSQLQSSNFENDAQYAVLLGHRLRTRLTLNARQMQHLTSLSLQNQLAPDTLLLINTLQDKIADAHPVLAEALRYAHGESAKHKKT